MPADDVSKVPEWCREAWVEADDVPDDVPDDEWNRMDPSVSSPLVAWLASDEADHVTGQVIRAVAENIILMKGWADGPTINNGEKRWDATKLGQQLATDVFFTRAPGLRY